MTLQFHALYTMGRGAYYCVSTVSQIQHTFLDYSPGQSCRLADLEAFSDDYDYMTMTIELRVRERVVGVRCGFAMTRVFNIQPTVPL